MNKENVQFQIDQLRKDKIIYAVESCSVTLIAIFGLSFSNQYFSDPLQDVVNTALLVLSVGYILYLGVSNFMRLNKIKRLEKGLREQ